MLIICHDPDTEEEQSFEITSAGISIGYKRSVNDIILTEPSVSSRHAIFSLQEQDLFIEDLGSLNGTYVNGNCILCGVRLLSGDLIQIGSRNILFMKQTSSDGEVLFELFLNYSKLFAPVDETPAPIEEEAGADGQKTASAEEKITPSEDEALPVEEKITPSEDEALPVEEKITPCEDEAEPFEDECPTAMTVMADANVMELIKSGKIDAIANDGAPDSMLDTSHSGSGLPVGKEIGKYLILKQIGKGGMGIIYLARHKTLNSFRALKVLSRNICEENDPFFERFLREARMASEIHHPNVVGVMDAEVDAKSGISYIVMEYIDGGNLRHILKSRGKLPEVQAAVIVLAVASALSAAAEHKIVHRDVKPDNIMFTKRGEVKLADLGIAKCGDDDLNLTQTNIMIGTPAYLSPEQVENPKAVDIRSDIYSLGATFYEMLTGRHPYAGATTYDILHKLFSEPVPDPRDKNAEVSPGISRIVMKMLDKNPDKRFQTPEELQDALGQNIPPFSASGARTLVRSAVTGVPPDDDVPTLLVSGFIRKKPMRRIPFRQVLRFLLTGFAVSIVGFVLFLRPETAPGPNAPVAVSSADRNSAEMTDGSAFPTPRPDSKTFPFRLETESRAEIQLTSPDGSLSTYRTDDKGVLKLDGLAPGEYSVRARKKGFRDYAVKFLLPAISELKIEMQPDSEPLAVPAFPGTRIALHLDTGRR